MNKTLKTRKENRRGYKIDDNGGWKRMKGYIVMNKQKIPGRERFSWKINTNSGVVRERETTKTHFVSKMPQ